MPFKPDSPKVNPENTDTQNLVGARQIERFLRVFRVGDRVITYDPASRKYLAGDIEGDPRYRLGEIGGLPLVRAVKWQGEVSRDELSLPTRNSLGAISTLLQVPDTAAAEIEAKLAGRPAAAKPKIEEDAAQDEKELLRDIQARSHEFVKDKISQLDWAQMQLLVAGLPRAMGYKTRVSPPGSDRGKDIVASPDGFGFESPRIVVEVKHRRGTMGAPEVRSFLGGRHKDDKGLYVSTGGFTREAQYEAERSNIPLTLMDLDELAKAVAEYYDRMDTETRSLVPLIRVYWPS